jgi:hypothetical protein
VPFTRSGKARSSEDDRARRDQDRRPGEEDREGGDGEQARDERHRCGAIPSPRRGLEAPANEQPVDQPDEDEAGDGDEGEVLEEGAPALPVVADQPAYEVSGLEPDEDHGSPPQPRSPVGPGKRSSSCLFDGGCHDASPFFESEPKVRTWDGQRIGAGRDLASLARAIFRRPESLARLMWATPACASVRSWL